MNREARQTQRAEGWGPFAAWAVVGGLCGLSLLGAASVGLLVLPLALLSLHRVARTARVWPEVMGGLVGCAALSLAVAVANRTSVPCPASGSGFVSPGSGAGAVSSCGGLDPVPWLVAGLVMAGAGVAVYAVARSRW